MIPRLGSLAPVQRPGPPHDCGKGLKPFQAWAKSGLWSVRSPLCESRLLFRAMPNRSSVRKGAFITSLMSCRMACRMVICCAPSVGLPSNIVGTESKGCATSFRLDILGVTSFWKHTWASGCAQCDMSTVRGQICSCCRNLIGILLRARRAVLALGGGHLSHGLNIIPPLQDASRRGALLHLASALGCRLPHSRHVCHWHQWPYQ